MTTAQFLDAGHHRTGERCRIDHLQSPPEEHRRKASFAGRGQAHPLVWGGILRLIDHKTILVDIQVLPRRLPYSGIGHLATNGNAQLAGLIGTYRLGTRKLLQTHGIAHTDIGGRQRLAKAMAFILREGILAGFCRANIN